MKKLILLVTAVCLLLALTGCASSQTTETALTAEESATTPDNSASFSEDEESSTEQENIISDDTDRDENTDAPAATDPGIAAPEETEPVEYDVHVGDSFFTAWNQCEDVELLYSYCCVIWKDSKGYCIACTDGGPDQVSAVVRFSDDLELLEADGLEPIDPIDGAEMEQWVGKTLDEFIEQYGQYHLDLASGLFEPAYISNNGTIYWMVVDYDSETDTHHMIFKFRSFSLKDLRHHEE
jgi:hypothetical protein